ncbi:hypothetical protein V8F33_012810 [Rhypophila sp. PSN 637]
MARIKFVDTYPEDGPLRGARKLAKSLGKLTPARNGVKLEDDDSEPDNISDAEDDSEEDAGPYAERIRGRNLVPRPDRPRVPTPPRRLRHTATSAAPSTSTQNTDTASPGSSQTTINARLNGNRDLFPGRILKTIRYAHETRKLMRGTPWTEEADLLILYLRRKGVPFRRIASQFIVHVTGHTRTACQQRWQRLKTLNAELSREEKAKFEKEMSRIERDQFPDGIPPEPPATPSAPAPPPAQAGTSGTSQDQNAGGSGSAANAFTPVDLTQDDDSDSTLTDPGSSSPPDPFDGPSSS